MPGFHSGYQCIRQKDGVLNKFVRICLKAETGRRYVRPELFIQAICTSVSLLLNDYSFVVDNRIHTAL